MVLRVLGVDTSWFKNVADDIGAFARGLIKRGGALIGDLIDAVVQGFRMFIDKKLNAKGLLESLKKEVLPGVKADPPLGDNDVGRWVVFVLDAVGLSWDDLLVQVQDAVGAGGGGILLDVLRKLDNFLEPNPWEGLKRWAVSASEVGLNMTPVEVAKYLSKAVVTGGQKLLLREALNFLLSLNPLGGVWRVVKTLWTTYTWVRDNLSRVGNVLQKFKDALRGLLPAEDGSHETPGRVATGVADALGSALDLVVSYVVRLLGGSAVTELQLRIFQCLQVYPEQGPESLRCRRQEGCRRTPGGLGEIRTGLRRGCWWRQARGR